MASISCSCLSPVFLDSSMQATTIALSDVMILQPEVFGDARGFFVERWNAKTFERTTGLDVNFVLDNRSRSEKGVLRGLHYQLRHPQGKLVWVEAGKVLDVIVDLRRSSDTFGRHAAIELTGEDHKQLWVPPGFAHGFVTLSEVADFFYKTTDYYFPNDEHCIRWDDTDLKIDWKLGTIQPQLSQKDRKGTSFREAETYS